MNAGRRIAVAVCPLAELADPDAREFSPPGSGFGDEYFIVRRGDELACFSNVCSHAAQPLNFAPNRFLSRDGSLIVCPAHGAVYEPISGDCLGGPCRGRGLRRWPVSLREGVIIAEVPPAPGG